MRSSRSRWTERRWTKAAGATWIAALVSLAAGAQPAPEKAAPCAACHGANGVPTDPSIPVIAGQQEGYLYVELRDYKLGNRRSDVMQPAAAGLEKADMQALAAWFAARPWPSVKQAFASAAQTNQAEVVIGSVVCESCHAAGFKGSGVIPRLAGQSAAYLRATMHAFRSDARANNPGMSGILKNASDSDIDALAVFLASLSP